MARWATRPPAPRPRRSTRRCGLARRCTLGASPRLLPAINVAQRHDRASRSPRRLGRGVLGLAALLSRRACFNGAAPSASAAGTPTRSRGRPTWAPSTLGYPLRCSRRLSNSATSHGVARRRSSGSASGTWRAASSSRRRRRRVAAPAGRGRGQPAVRARLDRVCARRLTGVRDVEGRAVWPRLHPRDQRARLPRDQRGRRPAERAGFYESPYDARPWRSTRSAPERRSAASLISVEDGGAGAEDGARQRAAHAVVGRREAGQGRPQAAGLQACTCCAARSRSSTSARRARASRRRRAATPSSAPRGWRRPGRSSRASPWLFAAHVILMLATVVHRTPPPEKTRRRDLLWCMGGAARWSSPPRRRGSRRCCRRFEIAGRRRLKTRLRPDTARRARRSPLAAAAAIRRRARRPLDWTAAQLAIAKFENAPRAGQRAGQSSCAP